MGKSKIGNPLRTIVSDFIRAVKTQMLGTDASDKWTKEWADFWRKGKANEGDVSTLSRQMFEQEEGGLQKSMGQAGRNLLAAANHQGKSVMSAGGDNLINISLNTRSGEDAYELQPPQIQTLL